VAQILPEPVGWKEQCWESWELEAVLVRAEGQPDTYQSQNRFRGDRRAVAQVLKLCGLFSDVDYYNVPELRSLSPEAMLEKARERLKEKGVPDPSLALSSGRGLTLSWQHAPVARKRLAEWNAAQNRIYQVLKPFGADPKARDAARVLRITGTTNSKNGATVRALGDTSEKTYRFEDLVEPLVMNPVWEDEEEHGESGADLYSLAVQRAARGLRNHPQGWSETSLWEGRLTDLQHLRRMRYGEGPMEDFRDRWLFLATTAISWLVVPEVLYRETLALAEEAGGWDEHHTRSDLSQVLKRARRRRGARRSSLWVGSGTPGTTFATRRSSSGWRSRPRRSGRWSSRSRPRRRAAASVCATGSIRRRDGVPRASPPMPSTSRTGPHPFARTSQPPAS